MSEETPNVNPNGNRDSDMSVSQSSGIDMQCETMSSQGGSQEGVKSSGSKSIEILQKALDSLKGNIPAFQYPANESDWTLFYENTLFKSTRRLLSYEEHLWFWLHLIIKAEQSEDNEQTLLKYYCKAISLLPIKIFESDTTWVALINGIYSHVIAGDISEKSASIALETAEQKFKYSPVHARYYWNAVLKNEKQIMKVSLKPLPQQHRKMVDLLKIRFSNPYLNMEDDYNEFSRWSLDVNLDKNLRFEVQQTFLEHSKLWNMMNVVELRENFLGDGKDWNHHLSFEKWIDELCDEQDANFDHIEIICEELIASEPDSFCYYWLYLNVLAMRKFVYIPKREEKIRDIILRGFQRGKTSCKGMDQRFLESSLVIASKTLGVGKTIELVESALDDFTVTKETLKWYPSSRGIIIAISNLVHFGALDDGSFKRYFQKIITPCTMDFFKEGSKPEELANKAGIETQYLELLRLWVQTQVSFYSLPWEQTLQMWTDIFERNKNPILLVGYVDFVKNQGKPQEIIEATTFALEQLSYIESCEEPLPITTQRCHIRLLQDHLEVLSTAGIIEKQIETCKKLQKKLNSYTNQYPHDIQDLVSPQLCIKGFSPIGSMVNQNSPETDEHSSDSVMNYDTNSDTSIVSQLKSLHVGPGSSQSEVETNGDGSKVAKVFVSNLSYNATEEDLMNAFKDKGFYPTNVEFMKTPEGKNRGMAHVTFESKDTADFAVQTCDKFIVCGRVTFVSPFKSGHKFSLKKTPQNQPTLLNIKNISDRYKDKDVIKTKLSLFGHVKNVDVQEQDDSTVCARVEFYMKEDAHNAYEQVVERKLFGDDATCRMGYPSSKRPGDEKKTSNEKKGKKKQPKKPKVREQNEMEVTQDSGLGDSLQISVETTENPQIGPQMPVDLINEKQKQRPKQKPIKGFTMVPTQALKDLPRVTKRTHMKAKLDIGVSSVSASSSGSSQDGPEKKIMRISTDEVISSVTTDDSTSSTDSPMPKKKMMRMDTDKDIEDLLHPKSETSNSPNGDETVAQELEFASNSNMDEEKASFCTKSSLSNKDFQKMFEKH